MRILTNDDVAKSVRESWERKLRPKIPDLTKPLPTHAWNLDASVEKEVTNTTVEVTPMSVQQGKITEIFVRPESRFLYSSSIFSLWAMYHLELAP